MVKIKNKYWFEVFKTNKDGSTETVYSNNRLAPCVKYYRKEKILDKTIKIDKWVKKPDLDIPTPYQSILN